MRSGLTVALAGQSQPSLRVVEGSGVLELIGEVIDPARIRMFGTHPRSLILFTENNDRNAISRRSGGVLQLPVKLLGLLEDLQVEGRRRWVFRHTCMHVFPWRNGPYKPSNQQKAQYSASSLAALIAFELSTFSARTSEEMWGLSPASH